MERISSPWDVKRGLKCVCLAIFGDFFATRSSVGAMLTCVCFAIFGTLFWGEQAEASIDRSAEADQHKKARTSTDPKKHHKGRDVRLALVIANEYGWGAEPRLAYAVKGDLRRMRDALRHLGFFLPPTLVLGNQDPQAIRTAFATVKRLIREKGVTTFFFYYSGHADKNHLHTGPPPMSWGNASSLTPDPKAPISYAEFASFLQDLRIPRRFALIDACYSGMIAKHFGNAVNFRRAIAQQQLPKGVEPIFVSADLKKYLHQNDPNAQTIHILASTADDQLAFESQKLKGSIFTHHFLRGLAGRAERGNKGTISMDDLANYVRPLVARDTHGQTPTEWKLHQGRDAYALAATYKSILEIPTTLQGRFKVLIGDAQLSWNTAQRTVAKLPVVVGKGILFHQDAKTKRCRSYALEVAPSQRIELQPALWQEIPCHQTGVGAKGEPILPMHLMEQADLTEDWSLELQGGMWGSNGLFKLPEGDWMGVLSVGMRWRYAAISVGTGLGPVSFLQQDGTSKAFWQNWLNLRGEGGYRHQWDRLDLFVGAYLGVGVLLHDLNEQAIPSFSVQGGLLCQLGIWLDQRWALLVSAEGGGHPAFVQEAQHRVFRLFATYSLRVGVRFRFGPNRLLF